MSGVKDGCGDVNRAGFVNKSLPEVVVTEAEGGCDFGWENKLGLGVNIDGFVVPAVEDDG